jgi:RNA polymerase sigma factor (TIGR02999 family)
VCAGVQSEPPTEWTPSATLLAAISHVSNAARTDQYETDVLFPVVYEELKRLAHHRLRSMGADATLCTTELVHEAFLKLSRQQGGTWAGRAHFFGAASRAMRQVLVDLARRRQAAKRGGDSRMVSLRDADATLEIEVDAILALDEALAQLGGVDRRLCRVVELRFFGGLPESEIAELLGVSARTVERDWTKAKLFLLEELERERDADLE